MLATVNSIQQQAEIERMNQSAIKIQAFVKGFLVRKMYEEQIIRMSRNLFYQKLFSLKNTEKYCFLNIGLIVKNAAMKLQKFARRAIFRMKIKRLKDAYDAYLENLRVPLYNYISRALICFYSKNILKLQKFELFRREKLKKIKENLAIYKIKYILKKKKINIKLIKTKIRRYKRLKKYSHQTSLLHATSIKVDYEEKKQLIDPQLISKLFSGLAVSAVPASAESNLNTQNMVNSEAFIQNSNDPAQRDTKITTQEISNQFSSANNIPTKLNRLSISEVDENIDSPCKDIESIFDAKNSMKSIKEFNITRNFIPKIVNIVPVLYQRELENRPENHHCNKTNASLIRMMESNPSRVTRKLEKKIQIRIKSAASKRSTPPSFSYLNDTVSSKLKCEEKFNNNEEKDYEYYVSTKPKRFNILKPTISSLKKKTEKKSNKSFSVPHSPPKLNEVIVPTIDNKAFKLRAQVQHSRNSRVQTPKSTKSCSVRRQSAPLVRRNSDFSPRTLTFEAALPEYSEILTNFMRPFYTQIKQKMGHA